jgi:hypothetical protein
MASTDQQSEERRNAAMAQLALQIRQGDGNSMVGAQPTDEELAAFYENRLDSTRRAQVMSYIANSTAVYERWMRCVDALGYMEEQQATGTVGDTAAKPLPFAQQQSTQQQKSSPGLLGRLFGSPAGIVGGGLATAAIIVLAVLLVPTMHNEFDLRQGVDGVYQDWGGQVSREWESLPPSAKPKPKLDQRGGFFAQPKPKSDIQKVLEAGLRDGMTRVGKQPLEELGIDVGKLSTVISSDITSLTPEQYQTVFETGRLAAVLAPQCYMDPDSPRLSKLDKVLKNIIARLTPLQTDDVDALLQGVKGNTDNTVALCSLTDNVVSLVNGK